MEIYLSKRRVRQIRTSAADAIEEGDTDTLREDLMDAFDEEHVEEIERRIDAGDFYEFIADIVEEWTGEEVDELFELLEAQLSEAGIEVKYSNPDLDEEDDEEDEEDEEDDDYEEDDL